ncbi:hypothetical protein DdX_02740 [Ditylenchus destructor]|uniref:Uncharacterized protein n=1 Tax=Ditylenchus destructor TaxID=166010 RepID=A0AAD4RCG4_9BILA|nr:hypothetical protein DdX_02740 [Ditylenchus destructor]
MLGLRSLRSLRPRRDNQYWVGFVKISAAFGGLDTFYAARTKFIEDPIPRKFGLFGANGQNPFSGVYSWDGKSFGSGPAGLGFNSLTRHG